MYIKQKESIDKLLSVIEELPNEKFSQLLNYAMFLLFEEKQIFTEQLFKNHSVSFVKPTKENEKSLNIPVFSCGGMKQEFNRADLYETKL